MDLNIANSLFRVAMLVDMVLKIFATQIAVIKSIKPYTKLQVRGSQTKSLASRQAKLFPVE